MSKTATIELSQLESLEGPSTLYPAPASQVQHRLSQSSARGKTLQELDRASLRAQSELEEEQKPRWNHPRSNIFKVLCCNFCLLTMGMNDAAYGALIPYIEKYYDLNYTVVSLIFISPFVGYVLASLSNNLIHSRFGQRGVAVVGASSKILAYIVVCLHPPYPALVVMYAFAGFGVGIEDAAWNAWIGDMRNANEMLGILHACYGLGATLSPLIATSMITKGNLPWWSFYYFLVSITVFELAICVTAFWSSNAQAFRESIAAASVTAATGGPGAATGGTSGDDEGAVSGVADTSASPAPPGQSGLRDALFKKPYARVTWLCCLFLFGYTGCEVALGGWIVTFMLRVRHGTAFSSGMAATGFWLGITLGRLVLGFVTPRIGAKLAIAIYLPISMALQLLFWLVPSFTLSAVFVALEGFFLGPLFPAAVVVTTKLLPKRLHISGIGFIVAFAGCGAASFPFIVGAVAQATSVAALQPLALGMLAVIFITWLCLPRLRKRD